MTNLPGPWLSNDSALARAASFSDGCPCAYGTVTLQSSM